MKFLPNETKNVLSYKLLFYLLVQFVACARTGDDVRLDVLSVRSRQIRCVHYILTLMYAIVF